MITSRSIVAALAFLFAVREQGALAQEPPDEPMPHTGPAATDRPLPQQQPPPSPPPLQLQPPPAPMPEPVRIRLLEPEIKPADTDRMVGAALGGTVLTWLAATVPAFVVGALASFGFDALQPPSSSIGVNNHFGASLGLGGSVGAAVGVGITYLMLPAVICRFADENAPSIEGRLRSYRGDISEARAEGLRRGSFGLAGMLVGLAAEVAGDYLGGDAGAGLMVGGLVLTGISYIAAWALDVSGIIASYQQTRRMRLQ
jgi:hypothetical protein